MIKRCGYRIAELTLGGVLADKANQHADRVFIHYLPDGRKLTYGEINNLSSWMASNLLSLGVGQGSHVAVMMENSPEQLMSYFALGKLGAIAVPINIAARGEQLVYYVDHSDACAIIVDAQYLDHAIAACERLPALRHMFVLRSPDAAADLPSTRSATVINFMELLTPAAGVEQITVRHSDVAALMYTSGTTGPSKANIFTHAHTLQYAADSAETHGYAEDDVFYVCLPLFHAMALQGNTLGTFLAGGSIALSRRFSASRFWRDIIESRATHASALGSVINILMSLAEQESDLAHKLRTILTAPIPSFAADFERRFNLNLVGGYGLSDFGHVVAYRAGEPASKIGSCGRPLPGVQLKIVDDDDFEVQPGEAGEIVLRRDAPLSMASGYYRMPEATVEANRNQWFHTGDRGRVDADGYLWFVDRKKDAIRRRGENISSFEVETVILSHPDVVDVAVYPVRSDMSEDEVAASIVLREGSRIAEADVTHYCVSNMAYFMVPRFIHLVPELPRNASQKVEKFRLRQDAEAKRVKLWDREAAGIVVRHTSR